MGQPVRLIATLFATVLMSAVHVPMAAVQTLPTAPGQKLRLERARQPMPSTLVGLPASVAGDPDVVGQRPHRPGDFPPAVQVDVEAQSSAQMGLSSWDHPGGPAPFSLFPKTLVGKHEGGAEDPLLVHDEHAVPNDGNSASSALERDWQGLGRDTAFFVGYEALAAGVGYLLPEHVTQWTSTQRRISLQRWWENVRNPKWDPDRWYFNYLGHPYFGAITYIRARERRFGVLGGFGYAALVSGLYEYGIEALFERPSYQDLLVTPVGGLLLGALLFEPLREHIQRKAELHWYDHVTLALTDPLGVSNSLVERLGGRQVEIRVQWHVPTLALSAPFTEPTAWSLDRPQKQYYRFYGIGIAFVF
jgi:hypothetical protein